MSIFRIYLLNMLAAETKVYVNALFSSATYHVGTYAVRAQILLPGYHRDVEINGRYDWSFGEAREQRQCIIRVQHR